MTRAISCNQAKRKKILAKHAGHAQPRGLRQDEIRRDFGTLTEMGYDVLRSGRKGQMKREACLSADNESESAQLDTDTNTDTQERDGK